MALNHLSARTKPNTLFQSFIDSPIEQYRIFENIAAFVITES